MTITLWCVLSLAAGIWTAAYLSIPSIWPVFPAALLLIAGVWLACRNNRQAVWLLAGACFLAGVVRGLQSEKLPADDISRFIGRKVVVTGVVGATPDSVRVDEERLAVRYRLRVESVKVGAITQPASGGLFASVLQTVSQPVHPYGARLILEGSLKELHGFNNPGTPDMVASWRRQGYTARLVSRSEPRLAGPAANGLKAKVHRLREAIIAKLKAAMPERDAAILTGALFGGYTGIPREEVRQYAATGIIHILSVSGSHIAFVAGAMHWLGGAIGLRSRPAAMLSATAVVGYALLAGPSPPVIRSVAMGLIALFAAVFGREKDSGNALALTAAGMLAYEPSLLLDISFQLSFGGTAGLVLFYSRTAARLQKLPAWLARPFAATAAAQLGIVPVMAWYFNSLPLVSFVANLLVVPIIELTVILGLAGGFVALLLPVTGQALLAICSLLISAANHLNAALALLPLAIYLPPLPLLGSLLYYAGLLWLYGYLPFLPDFTFVLRRHYAKLAVALATCLLCFFVLSVWPRPLSVHFIDVGQGDATLVVTPRGRAVLIDAGGSASEDFDIGERVVFPYLRRQGIRQLDYMILTHGHQDHAGGAAAVATAIAVKQLLLPPEERTPAVDRLLRLKQISAIPAFSGQSIILDGVQFLLLRPDSPVTAKRGRINETSCAVEVRYGQHSFLITGDLEGASELDLLAKGLSKQTVLKVGHHGARASTSPAFLAAVNPRYAVISVGADNRYGHPHPDTVKRLTDGGRIVFRTDRHGAIVFYTDGQRIAAKPYIP